MAVAVCDYNGFNTGRYEYFESYAEATRKEGNPD
jgi:hypothetical protein